MTPNAILREPLVHFLVLGVLVFALFAMQGDAPPSADASRIDVTEADIERLDAQFAATWRRPPTPAERAHLVARHVEEEVLVREAQALGLAQGDAVVRQRLAQKMAFLIESGAEAIEATDAALQAHLDANPERFERPALVAFDQVPLGEDEPAAALEALEAGMDPRDVGAAGLLSRRIYPSPPQVIDGTFGSGFFDIVFALAPDEWQGPVQSGYGPHLVRVTYTAQERLPDLAEIRDEVERDWRAETRARVADDRLEALKGRYRIALPPGLEDAAAQ